MSSVPRHPPIQRSLGLPTYATIGPAKWAYASCYLFCDHRDRGYLEEVRHVPTAKVREVLQMLAADGWILVRPGSHRQFHHPVKSGTVTVSGALGDDIDRGTLRSVFRQAGLEWPPESPGRRKGLR